MKLLPATLLIGLTASSCFAQSFEGTITYTQYVEVSEAFTKMGMTKEIMYAGLRETGDWYDTVRISFRQGDYYWAGNNIAKTLKIYLSSENKIYTYNSNGGDVCSVQVAEDLDLNGAPDKPTVTVVDSAVTIIGSPCKIIRMKWPLSQVDYYYAADKARVSPEFFSKHSSEGLAAFVQQTKCIPLQIVRNFMGFLIIQTATEVKPGKVNAGLFKAPGLVEDESLNVIKVPGVKAMRLKK